ncbi:MAG: hypothetical protein ACQETD_00960 [Pseudomonadota bacterium]
MRRLLSVVLIALLLAACSSKPSDQTIREQVTERLLERHGSTIFEVVNFQKTNGIPRDDNTYIAEVEYDLRFKLDLKEATEALQQRSGSIFAAGMEAASLGITYGDFEAGDEVHRKERVRFVRAEKGWLIDEEPESR